MGMDVFLPRLMAMKRQKLGNLEDRQRHQIANI